MRIRPFPFVVLAALAVLVRVPADTGHGNMIGRIGLLTPAYAGPDQTDTSVLFAGVLDSHHAALESLQAGKIAKTAGGKSLIGLLQTGDQQLDELSKLAGRDGQLDLNLAAGKLALALNKGHCGHVGAFQAYLQDAWGLTPSETHARLKAIQADPSVEGLQDMLNAVLIGLLKDANSLNATETIGHLNDALDAANHLTTPVTP